MLCDSRSRSRSDTSTCPWEYWIRLWFWRWRIYNVNLEWLRSPQLIWDRLGYGLAVLDSVRVFVIRSLSHRTRGTKTYECENDYQQRSLHLACYKFCVYHHFQTSSADFTHFIHFPISSKSEKFIQFELADLARFSDYVVFTVRSMRRNAR